MKGRPRSQPPKLAYDYRRYITLVQVLATGDYKALSDLCEAWGLKRQLDHPAEPNPLSMVKRMAQHAVEYHREKE